ncbi:hypothetical protein GCK32_004630 [Trichostrongylus colubriformis]|uniref:Neurotransmitter-gated ion-channel transmembrane domain-containing protein n=1 Tax=Trichostrongylus colubriformis TaxID=6319 RepID=A0AAN8FCI6_TRICO
MIIFVIIHIFSDEESVLSCLLKHLRASRHNSNPFEAIRLTPARKLLNELLPETYDTAVRPGPNGTATVVTLTLNKFILLAMVCSWYFEVDEVVVKPSTDRIEGVENQFEVYSLELAIMKLSRWSSNQVQLKRKPVYYVLVIQVTLVLNMFVSISLMLNLVADMMPKASRLPLLGNYILSEIFVCAGALSVSLVTLVLHQRCHTRCLRPPKWIERILLCQNSTNDVYPLTTLPPPYSSTEQRPTPEIFQRSDFVEAVEQATTALKTTINRLHKEDEIRLTWIRVFDRIDLVCLLAFQLANIVCSILFMR